MRTTTNCLTLSMGKKDKNKGKKDEQKATNPLVILTLAEQEGCENPREFPFYEEYHDSSYIISHDRRPNVSLKDPGEDRVYCLYNDIQKELVVYHIDGGLLNKTKAGDNKCDIGIYTEDELLILIELKGTDCRKAIQQIVSTIKNLGLEHGSKIKKLLARVVVSSGRNVPNIRESDTTKLKQTIAHYNGGFKQEYILIKSRKLEETLSKIQ